MPGLDALTAGAGQTDQRDARHALGGLLATQGPTALDVRTGVLLGPGSTTLLSGTATTGPKMSVRIGVHVAVTSRGTANGPYLGPTLEAPLEVDVELAPATGTRLDVVWVRQRDTTSGVPTPDASPGPQYGVLTGQVSSGTPAKPDLSTIVGAVELGTVQVSAGATSTLGAGVTITQTARLTAARGARVPVRSQAERDALAVWDGREVWRLDLGCAEVWTNGGWQALDREQAYTPALSGPSSISFGNGGSSTGIYERRRGGRSCHLTVYGAFGSPLFITAGSVRLSLPVPGRAGMVQIIRGVFRHAAGSASLDAALHISGASSTASIWVPRGVTTSDTRFGDLDMGSAQGAGTPAVPGQFGISDGSYFSFAGEYLT